MIGIAHIFVNLGLLAFRIGLLCNCDYGLVVVGRLWTVIDGVPRFRKDARATVRIVVRQQVDDRLHCK